jgi:hypothetical protein
MPSSWANQSNGLKIESSIHSQITALSATGVVHGNRIRSARTTGRGNRCEDESQTVENSTTAPAESRKTKVLRSVEEDRVLTAAMKV